MLCFVGLGNPGPEYANNRHNIGFMAVDAIHRRHGFSPWRRKFRGLFAEGRLVGKKALLLKPMTFMNLSGRAVGDIVHFYKIPLADVAVFYDELDLATGKLRVKQGGGSAGHNGIRSIDRQIGPDYRRVRLGIGHPGDKHRVTGHVLGNFGAADRAWLERFLDAVAEAAPDLAAGNDAAFMSRVALLTAPPKPAKPRRDGSNNGL